MLDQQINILKGWGFTYKTAGHWSKKTEDGCQAFGGGYVLRSAGEPFILGTIGRPKKESNSVRSVIEAKRRAHSQKPDEAYQAAEQLFPNAKRLDLFSRQIRPGWDAWGNETDKFKPLKEAG